MNPKSKSGPADENPKCYLITLFARERNSGESFRSICFAAFKWDDQQEILRYLHATKQITFFTRDLGFFRAPLRHANYCLVTLTVPVLETADYIAKFLRHPHFNTRAKRNGKVIKVSTKSINFWAIGRQQHGTVRW